MGDEVPEVLENDRAKIKEEVKFDVNTFPVLLRQRNDFGIFILKIDCCSIFDIKTLITFFLEEHIVIGIFK